MFCEECGTEIKKEDSFCPECGKKNKNAIAEKTEKKATNKKVEKKPMSKKNKIMIAVVAVVVVLVASIFLVGNSLFSAEAIVEKYAKAYLNEDYDTIMKLSDIKRNEFVTDKLVKKKFKQENKSKEKFKISVKKNELSKDAFIDEYTVSYLTSESTRTKTMTIRVKKDGKKLLLFNNYKIVDENPITASNVTVTIPEGTKLSIDGVVVKDKYKEDKKDKYSTGKGTEKYVIDTLTKKNVLISITLKNKMVIKKEVETVRDGDLISLTGYYSKVTLDTKTIKEVSSKIETSINTIVESAIAKKEVSSFKDSKNLTSKFVDSSTFGSSYESLISRYERNKAKEMKVTKVEIDSVYISGDELSVKAKVSYEYKHNDEYTYKDKDGKDSKTITFDFNLNEDSAKINDFSFYYLYYIF